MKKYYFILFTLFMFCAIVSLQAADRKATQFTGITNITNPAMPGKLSAIQYACWDVTLLIWIVIPKRQISNKTPDMEAIYPILKQKFMLKVQKAKLYHAL